MNIKDYISSGVLELYVLDQLSPAERREVEEHVNQYPEIRSALNEIEETLFAFASSTAKKPRAGLQSEIINNVLASDKNIDSPKGAGAGINKWLFPLALLGIIAAGILGWMWNQEREEKLELVEEILLEKDSCSLKDATILQLEQMLDNIFLPSSERILMAAAPGKSGEANIIYNRENRSVLLATTTLPTPPTGKQYQLWGIVEGTPISLGVFDISDGSELKRMTFAESVETFAITLEPQGGSSTPTLEEMWVIGNSTT